MTSTNRPAHEIWLGKIRATVWTNGTDHHDAWFNVSFSRAYRDGEQWRTSTSFGRDDLPLVSKAAEMAYAWIWKHKGSEDAGS